MYSPEQCALLRDCFIQLGFTYKHPLMKALDKQENIDLNTQDQYGYTPLRIAIQRQNSDAIKLLVELEPELKHLSDYDSAFLNFVRTSKKKPLKRLPLPSHLELVYCFQTLYSIDPHLTSNGMCFGLAQMRRRAFLCGERDVYLNRLKNIKSNLWPLVKKNLAETLYELNIEGPIPKNMLNLVFKKVRDKLPFTVLPYQIWYDWYAFFDGVILYSSSHQFPELFEPGSVLTQNALTAESLAGSIKMEEQGFSSKPSYIFSGRYTSNTLLTYFKCLEEAITNIDKPVSFTFHTGAHVFTVDYYQGSWIYTDSNYLDESEQECNSDKIVQIISKYYSQPLIFATKMYITPDVEEAMDKAIASMKKKPAWMKLHKGISKEQTMEKNSSGLTLLYVAATHGDLDMVKTCLKSGAVCQGERESKYSPLHIAIENGHFHIVQEFLKVPERKNSTSQKTYLNSTVVHLAAEHGHLDILRELIQYPDIREMISQRNIYGHTPLYLAAKSGHVDVVKELIQLMDDEGLIFMPDNNNTTPLHIAAEQGHLEVVQELLKVRRDDKIIYASDNFGRTALSYAASKGHLEIVQELLKVIPEDQLDQQINKPDHKGQTPLFAALEYNYWGVFNALFHAIKDKQYWLKKTPQGQNLLHAAASKGWLEIVQELIAFCDDETWFNQPVHSFGYTPLHFAAQKGDVAIIQELFKVVQEESARNQPEIEGITPFYLAAQNGHLKVVQEFIKEVPDTTIRNKPSAQKLTPLGTASFNGHLDIVQEILNAGIDESTEYTHTATNALFFAAQQGHLEIVRVLLKVLQNKKLANQGNSEGTTPLFIAAEMGHLEIVKEILNVLDEEETINKPNKKGQTPIYSAAREGHFEIVQELLKKVRDEEAVNQPSKKGAGPLHLAAQAGHLKIVQELLKVTKSKEIINRAADGRTAVFLAIENGFIDIAEELLNNGADPNKSAIFDVERIIKQAKNFYVEEEMSQLFAKEELSGKLASFSPLHMAVLAGRGDMVSLLLKHGAEWETPKDGLSVIKLATALGRLDLFPKEMLLEHRELEEMLQPVQSALKDYIEERNNRFLFKDLLSSGDKKAREDYIKYVSDACRYVHSGKMGVVEVLETGVTKFQGVHFQTTLHRLILEFVEPTPDEDYADQAQEILEKQELAYPEYVAQMKALDLSIQSMHEFGEDLREIESETLSTLATELKKDLDYFIAQHRTQPPDPLALKQFKTKFKSRLHSQDIIMCQQENWNSFALNLFLAVISVGLALLAQAIYSKWTTGQCSFFARGTEKQEYRDGVDCSLDGLVVCN